MIQNCFRKIFNVSSVQTFHLHQQFLICVTQDARNVSKTVHKIFEIVMDMGFFKVNVLIKRENVSIWTIYKYKPFLRSCNSIDIHKIESFSLNNYTSKLNHSLEQLYPSRHFKFPNCPLHISTISFEPFVIIRKKSNGIVTFDGFDVIVVNEIAKTMNLIPKYKQAPGKNNRGIIAENGSVTGAMEMVVNGTATMTIGAYALSLERASIMTPSIVYMQQAFIFAFVNNVILSTPLWRLMGPFQSYVWISIALLLGISFSIILLSKKLSMRQRHFVIGGRMNRTPILNLMNVLIGNVIPNRQMANRRYFGVFARTLTIFWIFLWLIIRNSYQGSLYGFLQTQRNNSPYDTVNKIRDSDVNIIIPSTSLQLIPKVFNTERLIPVDHGDFEGLENLWNGQSEGVFFSNDLCVFYFNFIKNSWHRISTSRDVVRPHTLVFYFRKNSILTWKFNRKIERCDQAGLITHWISKYRQKPKEAKYKGPSKLKMVHVIAILQISAIMYLIAFFVFLMEIFAYEDGYIKKVLDFLTY
ncbi:uncharacterized protein LOC116340609 [Contarinia nasturtii]|uniref:uncharacterized protein LOC116340609 n=1 Tax=Contarinia nasturtii TaxID=265458 RepID=UPI0012D383C8|nr:uncharacterized protein LOC116340609 [Contarinia nasturtii]